MIQKKETETYEYRTTKDLTCKKEEFKCNKITKQYNNQLYNIAIVNQQTRRRRLKALQRL